MSKSLTCHKLKTLCSCTLVGLSFSDNLNFTHYIYTHVSVLYMCIPLAVQCILLLFYMHLKDTNHFETYFSCLLKKSYLKYIVFIDRYATFEDCFGAALACQQIYCFINCKNFPVSSVQGVHFLKSHSFPESRF